MQGQGNILLLEGIHPGAKSNLEASGWSVDLLSTALSEDDLVSQLASYEVVGIRSKTKLTEKVLNQSRHLSAIGTFCIGTNQVDLNAANSLGIPVFNAPYSNTRSVAELVIAEMIALSRRLGDINTWAHKGKWLKSASGNREVRGKTLGIVGYGHIGSQVSVLAEALGLKVIFFDIVKKLPLGNALPMESLEEILKVSDFVTMHVPETQETKNLISKKQLETMKPESFLINASRGSVVNIEDLKQALQTRKISGAALDVFPKEPKNNSETFSSELQGLENVILTPHIGGSTEEAQVAIGQEVSDSLSRFLRLGSSFGAVNFPQVDPGRKIENTRRLLNVHKNTPGVMSEINSRISDVGANIVGQYLSTDDKIGFVVMDFEASGIKELAKEISHLESSIKTREL